MSRISLMIKESDHAASLSQAKTYTGWINCLFSSVAQPPTHQVEELFGDLADACILALLLEILTGEKIAKIRPHPAHRIHKIENNNLVLSFLRNQKIILPNIQSEDIVDMNVHAVLALIWCLIRRFQMTGGNASSQSSSDDEVRNMLIQFVSEKSGRKINNLTSDLVEEEGIVLRLMIQNMLHEYHQLSLDFPALEQAFDAAALHMNIAAIVDALDVLQGCVDEKAMMLYISMFKNYHPVETKDGIKYSPFLHSTIVEEQVLDTSDALNLELQTEEQEVHVPIVSVEEEEARLELERLEAETLELERRLREEEERNALRRLEEEQEAERLRLEEEERLRLLRLAELEEELEETRRRQQEQEDFENQLRSLSEVSETDATQIEADIEDEMQQKFLELEQERKFLEMQQEIAQLQQQEEQPEEPPVQEEPLPVEEELPPQQPVEPEVDKDILFAEKQRDAMLLFERLQEQEKERNQRLANMPIGMTKTGSHGQSIYVTSSSPTVNYSTSSQQHDNTASSAISTGFAGLLNKSKNIGNIITKEITHAFVESAIENNHDTMQRFSAKFKFEKEEPVYTEFSCKFGTGEGSVMIGMGYVTKNFICLAGGNASDYLTVIIPLIDLLKILPAATPLFGTFASIPRVTPTKEGEKPNAILLVDIYSQEHKIFSVNNPEMVTRLMKNIWTECKAEYEKTQVLANTVSRSIAQNQSALSKYSQERVIEVTQGPTVTNTTITHTNSSNNLTNSASPRFDAAQTTTTPTASSSSEVPTQISILQPHSPRGSQAPHSPRGSHVTVISPRNRGSAVRLDQPQRERVPRILSSPEPLPSIHNRIEEPTASPAEVNAPVSTTPLSPVPNLSQQNLNRASEGRPSKRLPAIPQKKVVVTATATSDGSGDQSQRETI